MQIQRLLQKASKQTRRPTVKIVFKLFITSNNTV